MNAHKPPSQTQPRILIRLPDGMKDELKESAHANYRSLNAEVVARLRRDMDTEKKTAPNHTA